MAQTTEVFTLRFWQEMLNDRQSEWRGKVHHVGSGQTRYFRDSSQMVKFITEALATTSKKSSSTENEPETNQSSIHERHKRITGLKSKRLFHKASRELRREAYLAFRRRKAGGQSNRKAKGIFSRKWRRVKWDLPIFLMLQKSLRKNAAVLLIATAVTAFGWHELVLQSGGVGLFNGLRPLVLGLVGGFGDLNAQHWKSSKKGEKEETPAITDLGSTKVEDFSNS